MDRSIRIHCIAVFGDCDHGRAVTICTICGFRDSGRVSVLIMEQGRAVFIHIMGSGHIAVLVNGKLDIIAVLVSWNGCFLVVKIGSICGQGIYHFMYRSSFALPSVDLCRGAICIFP